MRVLSDPILRAFSVFFSAILALTLAMNLACPKTARAEGRRFRRALVISGGGIDPGFSVGIIAGAVKAGWKPDVIIATCGASMGAAIWNAYPDEPSSYRYLLSDSLREILEKVKIEKSSLLAIQRTFESVPTEKGLHQYFQGNILSLPEDLHGYLPRVRFNDSPGEPRMIFVAALAHFGPADVGHPVPTRDRFSEAFFTDPDTARSLDGLDSPIRQDFPGSYLAPGVKVISNRTTEQAVRASVSDPFLVNPGRIGDHYFFTGAVDLFPLQLAHQLADEVIATYPPGLFTDYEEEAFGKTFGFSQRTRTLQAIQDSDVQWIDLSGTSSLRFDPAPGFLFLENHIPAGREAFDQGVEAQYRLGYERAQEAVAYRSEGKKGISYLRKPISPALLNGFDCRNAWVWRTPSNSYCTDDSWPGCERGPGTGCVPIR